MSGYWGFQRWKCDHCSILGSRDTRSRAKWPGKNRYHRIVIDVTEEGYTEVHLCRAYIAVVIAGNGDSNSERLARIRYAGRLIAAGSCEGL